MPERGGGGPGQGIELAMPMPLSGLAATQLSGGVPTPLIASARKVSGLFSSRSTYVYTRAYAVHMYCFYVDVPPVALPTVLTTSDQYSK